MISEAVTKLQKNSHLLIKTMVKKENPCGEVAPFLIKASCVLLFFAHFFLARPSGLLKWFAKFFTIALYCYCVEITAGNWRRKCERTPGKIKHAANIRERCGRARACGRRAAASRNNFAKAFTLEAQGQRITPNGLHTPKRAKSGEWLGVKLRAEGYRPHRTIKSGSTFWDLYDFMKALNIALSQKRLSDSKCCI